MKYLSTFFDIKDIWFGFSSKQYLYYCQTYIPHDRESISFPSSESGGTKILLNTWNLLYFANIDFVALFVYPMGVFNGHN